MYQMIWMKYDIGTDIKKLTSDKLEEITNAILREYVNLIEGNRGTVTIDIEDDTVYITVEGSYRCEYYDGEDDPGMNGCDVYPPKELEDDVQYIIDKVLKEFGIVVSDIWCCDNCTEDEESMCQRYYDMEEY